MMRRREFIGIDSRKDVKWVSHPLDESAQLLAEGKVDALLAMPPEAQELRAKKIGHVVVNTMMDRPWSQYFCCVPTGHREYGIRRQLDHPSRRGRPDRDVDWCPCRML